MHIKGTTIISLLMHYPEAVFKVHFVYVNLELSLIGKIETKFRCYFCNYQVISVQLPSKCIFTKQKLKTKIQYDSETPWLPKLFLKVEVLYIRVPTLSYLSRNV